MEENGRVEVYVRGCIQANSADRCFKEELVNQILIVTLHTIYIDVKHEIMVKISFSNFVLFQFNVAEFCYCSQDGCNGVDVQINVRHIFLLSMLLLSLWTINVNQQGP